MMPETHYARSGDVRIPYQVVGDGPFDLVFVPGLISNLDLQWEDLATGASDQPTCKAESAFGLLFRIRRCVSIQSVPSQEIGIIRAGAWLTDLAGPPSFFFPERH